MRYRQLGKTGIEVGEVSLGTEYLINMPLGHVKRVVDNAVEAGVNYFDLFYGQAGFRDILGEALAKYRRNVSLAAHLGAASEGEEYRKTRDVAEAVRYFEDFLARYRTDHVDVVFIHNSDGAEDFAELRKPGGFFETAARLKREGRARAVGFSSHTVETARAAVETGEVEVLMYPINPTGHGEPGRAEMLSECARRGVGVVAMKPFAGGKLLAEAAAVELNRYTSGSGSERSVSKPGGITAARLLAYALAQPGVACAVPGCKDEEELAKSLRYLNSADEERDFSGVVEAFGKHDETGECVYCNHCLPCPAEIDIGRTMRVLDLARGGNEAEARRQYSEMKHNAWDCILCGTCEDRCPFGVGVIAKMEEARGLFGE